MIFTLAAMLGLWTAPSSTIAQVPTTVDSLRVSIKYGRSLEEQLTGARGDLRITKRNAAAADSVHVREQQRRDALYELALAGRDQRIIWLEDQTPKFWEKPVFVGLTVMALTIWAVLKAITISM